MRLLIIEDEKLIADNLKTGLEQHRFSVDVAYTGKEGYKLVNDFNYDVIILDLMLPDMKGEELCRKLRHEKNETSIIMLTAKSQEAEIVTGLELGADDYITKPFSVLELLARIKAVFRRIKSGSEIPEVHRFGNLEINFKKYEARKKGKPLKLSPREYELLKCLIEHEGEIVSRDELLNQVWGYDSFPDTRTIDAHIAKLRHKIEDNPEEPKLIVTIHGIGYKFL